MLCYKGILSNIFIGLIDSHSQKTGFIMKLQYKKFYGVSGLSAIDNIRTGGFKTKEDAEKWLLEKTSGHFHKSWKTWKNFVKHMIFVYSEPEKYID